LRELSARLLHVQDDERRRIARDLHDGTGQMLALLSMTLSGLEAEAGKFSPELAMGLAENVEIVKEVSAELRTLSYLLHPPLLDETGLESALRWYVDGFGKRSGIEVALDLPDDLGSWKRPSIGSSRNVSRIFIAIPRVPQQPFAYLNCRGRLLWRSKTREKGSLRKSSPRLRRLVCRV
jgi:Histidine kinase